MPVGRPESLNRFGYHKGTSETMPKHEQLRETYMAFAEYLDSMLPDGRAKSTTMTWLQQSSMWANFAIAESAPVIFPKGYVVDIHDDPTVHAKAEPAAGDAA